MNLRKFFNPEGKHFGLFFVKFIMFSIIAWGIWMGLKTPYNHLLKSVCDSICESKFPLIESRYTEDRGTYEAMFTPYMTGPLKPIKMKPFAIKIFFNTVHFNFIPFLALLLASPMVSKKRLIYFILFGFIFLVCTHIFHVYMDINHYYFKVQLERGYFPTHQVKMDAETYKQYWIWKKKILFNQEIQGFMEQAGSMIVPAFVWLIYASSWILKALQPKTIPVKQTVASNEIEKKEEEFSASEPSA